MKPTRLFTATALSFAFTGLAHAGLVTWGAPTNISGDSDVSTAGTLVGALNLGNPGVPSVTLNGTTFTGLAVSGPVSSGVFSLTGPGLIGNNTVGSALAPFSTLSAPYQTLLGSTGGSFSPWTMTMSGLTLGDSYQFQWWTNFSSNNFPGFATTGTSGNSVTLTQETNGVAGGTGQFVIGTFVADSTTQAVVFSTPNAAAIGVNAVQLRDLSPSSVPEPGTALFGLALAGATLVRRRR